MVGVRMCMVSSQKLDAQHSVAFVQVAITTVFSMVRIPGKDGQRVG